MYKFITSVVAFVVRMAFNPVPADAVNLREFVEAFP